MKPKPFWVLKNFTVPVAIAAIPCMNCVESELSPKRFPPRRSKHPDFQGVLKSGHSRAAQQGELKKQLFQRRPIRALIEVVNVNRRTTSSHNRVSMAMAVTCGFIGLASIAATTRAR